MSAVVDPAAGKVPLSPKKYEIYVIDFDKSIIVYLCIIANKIPQIIAKGRFLYRSPKKLRDCNVFSHICLSFSHSDHEEGSPTLLDPGSNPSLNNPTLFVHGSTPSPLHRV